MNCVFSNPVKLSQRFCILMLIVVAISEVLMGVDVGNTFLDELFKFFLSARPILGIE